MRQNLPLNKYKAKCRLHGVPVDRPIRHRAGNRNPRPRRRHHHRTTSSSHRDQTPSSGGLQVPVERGGWGSRLIGIPDRQVESRPSYAAESRLLLRREGGGAAVLFQPRRRRPFSRQQEFPARRDRSGFCSCDFRFLISRRNPRLCVNPWPCRMFESRADPAGGFRLLCNSVLGL